MDSSEEEQTTESGGESLNDSNTTSTTTATTSSVVWNGVDSDGANLDPSITNSTTDITQSNNSTTNNNNISTSTANIVALDGSVNIIEHTPSSKRNSLKHNSPAPIMIEVPTEEVHPLNYERNSTIPEHTWKRKLSNTYKPLKEFKVSVVEGIRLMGLGFRMYRYTNRERGAGRPPIIDPFSSSKAVPTMGVPVGGIGAGTIGRGWKGDFVKWQLFPGTVHTRTVDADQFSAYIEVEPPGASNITSPRISRQVNTTSTVLSPNPKPNPSLQSWGWKLKGDQSTYHALYPRAWTTYEEHPTVKMECRQITPVFPHNYKESSYPVGVFVWKITNTGKTKAHVSVMFTFQNGTGSSTDLKGGHVNKLFETNRYNEKVTGVTMAYKRVQDVRKPLKQKEEQNLNKSTTLQNPNIVLGDSNEDMFVSQNSEHVENTTQTTKKVKPVNKTVNSNFVVKSYADPCTFAIAAKKSPGVEVSYVTRWITNNKASATALWDEFAASGVLANSSDEVPSHSNQSIGAAVAAKVSLAPGETKEVVFALAWDVPIVRFGSGSAYYRRYTRFYGKEGDSAVDIVTDALHSYPMWEKMISDWQSPILADPGLPSSYKHALFNELYYIADGGAVWTNENVSGKKLFSKERYGELTKDDFVGHFAYLEGQEYLMYNTYDVHFYASFALAMHWPLLELSLQRDIGLATLSQDDSKWEIFYDGKVVQRKASGAVPHDVGTPGEDPWFKVNSYCIQDISRWKDLPSKFVLQVYRDYVATKNVKFVSDLWDVVETVISRAATYDTDGDGVVDNEGFPDQTYDTWSATGCSAYSGGLWVAALSAAANMAELLGHAKNASLYYAMFEKAKTSYDTKLWNGKYYNYDCSKNSHFNSIMADQLAGEWYARACGLPPIVPPSNAKSALLTVYQNNVKKFGTGDLGAVNGMKPNGLVDDMCLQSLEVWTGTTYAVAAAMLQEGLEKEAFATAEGVINSTYERFGYQFQTPEAWDVKGGYRSAAYMRPLAIWAIQWAWENQHKQE